MSMIPVLFIIGVAFGYFVVLPAAVRFLQNFNSDQFNILLQARDYYKFAVLFAGGDRAASSSSRWRSSRSPAWASSRRSS